MLCTQQSLDLIKEKLLDKLRYVSHKKKLRAVDNFLIFNTYLNVSNRSMENRKVRRLLFVLRRKLFFQHLKTFLEMRSSILLKFIVHFPRSRTNHAWSGLK